MEFYPHDPFPLLPEGFPYESQKLHGLAADAWLGLQVGAIEATLADPRDGSQRWIRKGPGVFLTPYTEIRKILSLLDPQPGELVVDLGAGYGRMGFVVQRHYPLVHFLGIELVEERVQEGNRVLALHGEARACGGTHASVRLERADLASDSYPLPRAQHYFLYDFGSRSDVARVLEKLKGLAKQGPVGLVGRGREIRDQVERKHPWLTVVEPRHFENFSLYRSN